MLTKRQLTELFLKEAGFSSSEVSVKEWMKIVWTTPHSPIGFRLTSKGHAFLSSTLKLQSYTYKIKPGTVKSLKLFLQMNKYLEFPFYLKGEDSITLYGEVDATMLGLMSGDIASYLENFTRS
jgi:hypothetical protein